MRACPTIPASTQPASASIIGDLMRPAMRPYVNYARLCASSNAGDHTSESIAASNVKPSTHSKLDMRTSCEVMRSSYAVELCDELCDCAKSNSAAQRREMSQAEQHPNPLLDPCYATPPQTQDTTTTTTATHTNANVVVPQRGWRVRCKTARHGTAPRRKK